MASDLLGGLGEKPSGVRITRFGNRAMMAMVGGLPDAGNEAKIACSVIGVAETTPITQGTDDRLRDSRTNTGKCHDEPDVLSRVADFCELEGEFCLFGLEMSEQLHVTVDHQAIGRIQGETLKPLTPLLAKYIGDWGMNQPLGKDAMDTVLQPGLLTNHGSPMAGELT